MSDTSKIEFEFANELLEDLKVVYHFDLLEEFIKHIQMFERDLFLRGDSTVFLKLKTICKINEPSSIQVTREEL